MKTTTILAFSVVLALIVGILATTSIAEAEKPPGKGEKHNFH